MDKVASGPAATGTVGLSSFHRPFGSYLFGPCERGDLRFICVLTTLFAATLLFARLGHYALWDDEAVTALTAKGILLKG